MSVSALLKIIPGFRLIDGTLINQMIDNINSVTSNGTARNTVSQQIALSVNNATNTDFTFTPPAGATITSMVVYTTTAFTAVTDAKIEIGTSAGDASFVAATTIKALGVFTLTPVAAAAATFLTWTGSMFVRIVQSGGNTAVGNATLVVTFDVPA